MSAFHRVFVPATVSLLAACTAFGSRDIGYISPQGIVIQRDAFLASRDGQSGFPNSVTIKAVSPNTPPELFASQSVTIASAQFDANGVALLVPRHNRPDDHFIIADNAGAPLRLHSGSGAKAYTFCSPILNQQLAKAATANRSESARQQAEALKRELATAQASLSSNRAYHNGQCAAIEARPLPPKPRALSNEEAAFQSIGSAVDLAMRRFNAQEVAEALLAVRMDQFLQIYSKWKQGNQESCAFISPSQADNWVCDKIYRIAGNQAVFSCVQDLVKSYANQAMEACRAPLSAWESEVSAIKSEPGRLFSDCQQNLEIISKAKEKIPQLEMEAAINSEESNKLASSLNANSQRVSLSDAICE